MRHFFFAKLFSLGLLHQRKKRIINLSSQYTDKKTNNSLRWLCAERGESKCPPYGIGYLVIVIADYGVGDKKSPDFLSEIGTEKLNLRGTTRILTLSKKQSQHFADL